MRSPWCADDCAQKSERSNGSISGKRSTSAARYKSDGNSSSFERALCVCCELQFLGCCIQLKTPAPFIQDK
ncbi:hypothetical protein Hanom_Chr11g00974681 [Helianthus anomalus]